MEGQFQTSFIPKKPVGTQPTLGKPARTTNLFTIIVIILFVTTLLIGGAVYIYSITLEKKSETVQASLTEEINNLQKESKLINEMGRFDTRLETIKSLLANHVALTEFFDFLSDNTTVSVAYTGFKYSTTEQALNVSMIGKAKSFASLALQSDRFLTADGRKYVKGFSYTNYTLDRAGDVTFNLSMTLDRSAVLYSKTLSELSDTAAE